MELVNGWDFQILENDMFGGSNEKERAGINSIIFQPLIIFCFGCFPASKGRHNMVWERQACEYY